MTQGTFARILNRYGQDVTVYTQENPHGTAVRAFFQPMRDKEDRQHIPTPLGTVCQDRFLYLGPSHLPLDDSCTVRTPNASFRARAVHPVYAGEQLIHWWGIFARREGDTAQ